MDSDTADPLATARIPLVGDITTARPSMVEYEPPLNPAAFAPYRAEIHDCCCELCLSHDHALSRTRNYRDLGYRDAWEETEATADAILAALNAGTHQRVTYMERAAS